MRRPRARCSSPSSSATVPARMPSSEDLPVPLRPIRPMRSPASIANEARSSSGRSPYASSASARVRSGMGSTVAQRQNFPLSPGSHCNETPQWRRMAALIRANSCFGDAHEDEDFSIFPCLRQRYCCSGCDQQTSNPPPWPLSEGAGTGGVTGADAQSQPQATPSQTIAPRRRRQRCRRASCCPTSRRSWKRTARRSSTSPRRRTPGAQRPAGSTNRTRCSNSSAASASRFRRVRRQQAPQMPMQRAGLGLHRRAPTATSSPTRTWSRARTR